MVYLPDFRNPTYVGVSDDELRARLPVLQAEFDQRGEHGGSPGEGAWEEMDAIDLELRRRATAHQ